MLAIVLLLLVTACDQRDASESDIDMDMEPVALMMNLASDGRITWGGEALTQQQLISRLQEDNRNTGTVIVFTDPGVSRQNQRSLEQALETAGFSEVVFRDRP